MTVNNGDTIRATAKLVGPDNQSIQNVFYYQYTGTGSATDDAVTTALAAQIDDIYQAAETVIVNDVVDDEIEFFNLTQSAPMGSKLFDGFQGGTDIGDPLPIGVAGLITATTGVKRVLPKKFVAGLSDTRIDGDNLTAATLTALAAFATNWLEEVLVGAIGTLTPGTWRRAVTLFAPILSATVKGIAAYQRRRKPGVGA